MQGASRRRPPRPPLTLSLLRAIKAGLDMNSSFDSCVWAAVCCAFFGLMRFGEVSVKARRDYDCTRCASRGAAIIDIDLSRRRYARIRLPHAKTAKPGDSQDVFLVEEGDVCPIESLIHMAVVTPAREDDPLFSWRDGVGNIRPLTRSSALKKINEVLTAAGFEDTFGHSARIGGASFYLAKGVAPEIVRLHGRWKSLAYQTYIRAFEQVASLHLSNLV